MTAINQRFDDSRAEGRADGAEPPALLMHGLSKAFGPRRAIRALSLRLEAGERLAIIGPNGAGKTTLIRLLSTLLRPTAGRFEVCGFDTATDSEEARRRLGVVLHETLLYPDLTVDENLRFFARLYDVPAAAERITTICERLDLAGLRGNRVRRLSRGQQQRTALARALLHDPPLLLFDEPDTGLDAASFERLRAELLREPGRSIVFSTHHAGHALALATRVLLLQAGRAADLGAASRWSADDLIRAIAAAAPPAHA
jgi:heme exporter protein A